jgi:secreted PhoX family phosphatase
MFWPWLGTTNWITTTIAGQAGSQGNFDGTNSAAQFNGPDGIAVDAAGDLYVSDAGNNTIRKMVLQGTNWVVTTIGGQLNHSHGAADGIGTAASFYHPAGLTVDNQGRVFVADYQNDTIRMGTPSTVTNPPPALQMATAGGAAYVMWPSSATGCVLQTSTNLNAGPWQTVSNGITTNCVFSGPMTNGQTFFRLLQQ